MNYLSSPLTKIHPQCNRLLSLSFKLKCEQKKQFLILKPVTRREFETPTFSSFPLMSQGRRRTERAWFTRSIGTGIIRFSPFPLPPVHLPLTLINFLHIPYQILDLSLPPVHPPPISIHFSVYPLPDSLSFLACSLCSRRATLCFLSQASLSISDLKLPLCILALVSSL